jgi:hypothetical protein
MSVISTSPASASHPAKTIELSRAHVLVVAVLACMPVPLLSLVETAVPIPDLVARAAATLIPFVDSTPDQGSSVPREPTTRVHQLAVPADAAQRSILIRTEASTGFGRGARTTGAQETGGSSPGQPTKTRSGPATGSTGESAKVGPAAATDPVVAVAAERSVELTETGGTSKATDKGGKSNHAGGSNGGSSHTGKGSGSHKELSSAKGSSWEKQAGADKGSSSDKGPSSHKSWRSQSDTTSSDTSPATQGNAPISPPGEPEAAPADSGADTRGAGSVSHGGGRGGNGPP